MFVLLIDITSAFAAFYWLCKHVCSFVSLPTHVSPLQGFYTARGELVRSILFPKPTDFYFYKDLMKMLAIFLLLGIAVMGWGIHNFIKIGVSFFPRPGFQLFFFYTRSCATELKTGVGQFYILSKCLLLTCFYQSCANGSGLRFSQCLFTFSLLLCLFLTAFSTHSCATLIIEVHHFLSFILFCLMSSIKGF